MVESAEDRGLRYSVAIWQPMLVVAGYHCRLVRFRKARPQCGMRSAAVVVNHELTNHAPEMSFVHWDQIVQTLAANRPDYPFAICIRHRTSNRSLQHLQTKSTQRLI